MYKIYWTCFATFICNAMGAQFHGIWLHFSPQNSSLFNKSSQEEPLSLIVAFSSLPLSYCGITSFYPVKWQSLRNLCPLLFFPSVQMLLISPVVLYCICSMISTHPGFFLEFFSFKIASCSSLLACIRYKSIPNVTNFGKNCRTIKPI